MFVFLEFIFICIALVNSGTISPSGTLPIYNSIANCNQQADYTITFIADTSIPAGGQLYITFPRQYTSGLGITTISCSVSCAFSTLDVDARTVILTFPTEVYNGTVSNVTIYQVQNPSYSGGTGMFILKSYTGQNLLDENEIFGVIGIASAVNLLTNAMVTLISGGVSTAGAFTTYLIRFRTASNIPWNSYIKITIPISSGFVLNKFPACSSYPISNQILPGVLQCETVDSDVIVTGFNDNIAANTDAGILIPMQNPGYSTTTNVFQVAIYRGGTQLIYDWVNNIAGVTITVGALSSISLTPINPFAYQSMNKVMDYTLRFTLANVLTSSSVITITFPATFSLAVNANYKYYAIDFGLEDISEFSTVAMTYSNNQLLISNFLPTIPNTEVSLTLRITNPNANGYTTPLELVTYTNSSLTTVVDQDLTSATAIIDDYTSTNSLTLLGITTNPTPALANGAIVDLIFSINPAVSIPAGGFIKVRIPNDFKVDAPFVTTSCYLAAGVTTPAFTCWASGNVITIESTVMKPYTAGTVGVFSILGQVETPTYNSTFLFDIETYDVDGVTMLESYSDYLTIIGNSLVTYSLNLFGNSVQNSILDFTLTTIQALPAGGPQYKATDIQGRIQLIFLTTGWANDLGTGISNGDYLTCKAISGIVGINGQEITCQLMVAVLPRITIKNFESIPANTPIRFQVIYVVPPTGTNTHTIQLSLISLQNRIYANLNQIVFTQTISAIGGVTYSQTLNLVPTTWQVNSYFDVTFNPNIAIAINSYILVILPAYDTNFIQLDSIISCSVQPLSTSTFIPISCIPYYGVDWIMMQVPMGLTNAATIQITNLVWPRYVKALTSTFCFQTAVFNPVTFVYATLPQAAACAASAIGTPIPGGFDLAMISVPEKGLGYVDCSYTFTFQIGNDIPANSQLVLTFPTTYSLINSNPAPTFSAPLLSGYNGNSLQFSTTSNTLTVSNIDEYPANTQFQILATGIKNPSSGITSSVWNVNLYYNGASVNSQPNFFSFPFGPTFTTGFVIINQISAYPVNADEYADYTIVFTPQTDIPIAGQISVTFPGNQYKQLPGDLNCNLTGGIQTFTSCILSSTTVNIVTGQRYSSGVGSIYLTIQNILNPDAGTTDGFTIKTSYDGVNLDVTDTSSLTGRTFTSIAKAQTIYVSNLSFDPQNEGEESTYNFTFVTTNMIDSANFIVIIFPDDYSPSIGPNIQCDTYSGLIGVISCSVSNRAVYITNFETYVPSASKPVGILIYGVINPNQNDAGQTGYFTIGTQILSTAQFLDYNSAVGYVSVLVAPGWATLYNVTTANVYSRITSDFTFDFNTLMDIPKTSSLGAIYIDFPTQFSIPDSTDLTCDTPTTNFASMISCSISRNRVYINGQTADYLGEINLTVYSIMNPIYSGQSDNINVRTYDGLNKKIIERSFDNLDPFNFFYVYPGPLIIVNNGNDIVVDRGTQSQDLYFTFDYPSSLNITIKPTLPGFSLIPYENDISVGTLMQKFRVSVPMNFYDGDYYVIWTTLFDLNTYYTPLEQTKVTVTKIGGNLITIQPILDVPFGGQSLKTFITTPNSPDIGVTIQVNFLTEYKGMTLDTTSINMIPGMNSVNFTIFSSTDPNALGISSQTGTLSFILGGVNANIFTLASSTINFLMVASDTLAPLLNSFTVYNISQTNVFLSISVNEPVHLYYMIALAGTLPPSLAEIENQGPPAFNTTLSTYGFAVLIDSSTTPYIFMIDGLTANIDYVVYAYLQDRGFNVNSVPYNLTFTTADIYAVADFSISLNQPTTDGYDVISICNSIAFILSLEPEKVQERQYVLVATSRILQNSVTSVTVVSTILNLQILPMPDNPFFPAPTDLAASLVNKTTELSARISYFDTTYQITYSEVPRYKPKFVGNVLLTNYTYESATFTFTLNNYGWGYIVAIPASEDTSGTYPSSFQISLGYNQSNAPLDNYGSVEVTESYQVFNITLNYLESETTYNAYAAAGSANPGYPDLMDDNFIQKIIFFTEVAPPIERLDINGQIKMKGIILEVICLIIIFIIGF